MAGLETRAADTLASWEEGSIATKGVQLCPGGEASTAAPGSLRPRSGSSPPFTSAGGALPPREPEGPSSLPAATFAAQNKKRLRDVTGNLASESAPEPMECPTVHKPAAKKTRPSPPHTGVASPGASPPIQDHTSATHGQPPSSHMEDASEGPAAAARSGAAAPSAEPSNPAMAGPAPLPPSEIDDGGRSPTRRGSPKRSRSNSIDAGSPGEADPDEDAEGSPRPTKRQRETPEMEAAPVGTREGKELKDVRRKVEGIEVVESMDAEKDAGVVPTFGSDDSSGSADVSIGSVDTEGAETKGQQDSETKPSNESTADGGHHGPSRGLAAKKSDESMRSSRSVSKPLAPSGGPASGKAVHGRETEEEENSDGESPERKKVKAATPAPSDAVQQETSSVALGPELAPEVKKFDPTRNPFARPAGSTPPAAKFAAGPAPPLAGASQAPTAPAAKTDFFMSQFGKYSGNPWSAAKPDAEAAALFGEGEPAAGSAAPAVAAFRSKGEEKPAERPDNLDKVFSKCENPFASAKPTAEASALFGSAPAPPAPSLFSSASTSPSKLGGFGSPVFGSSTFGVKALDQSRSRAFSPSAAASSGAGFISYGAAGFAGFGSVARKPSTPKAESDSGKESTPAAAADDGSATPEEKVKTFDDVLREGGESGYANRPKIHVALGGFTDADRAEGFGKQTVSVTGEEGWELIKAFRCKLHELGSDGQWHERGAGPLRLLQNEANPLQYRLVMRTDAVLRLILNGHLFQAFSWDVPTEKQLRFTLPADGGKMISYLARFGRAEVRQDFEHHLEDVVGHMKREVP